MSSCLATSWHFPLTFFVPSASRDTNGTTRSLSHFWKRNSPVLLRPDCLGHQLLLHRLHIGEFFESDRHLKELGVRLGRFYILERHRHITGCICANTMNDDLHWEILDLRS